MNVHGKINSARFTLKNRRSSCSGFFSQLGRISLPPPLPPPIGMMYAGNPFAAMQNPLAMPWDPICLSYPAFPTFSADLQPERSIMRLGRASDVERRMIAGPQNKKVKVPLTRLERDVKALARCATCRAKFTKHGPKRTCRCKEVAYCDDACLEKDRRHVKRECVALLAEQPPPPPRQAKYMCSGCFREKATKRCARCKITRYCSVECQRRDWEEHRKRCEKRNDK